MKDRLDAPSPRAARIRAAAVAAALLPALVAGAWAGPAVASGATADVALEVSFAPDAKLRLRGDRFAATTRAAASDVNAVVARHDVVRVERLVRESEASLDATRRRLLAAGVRDVPDLNRHYRIVASGGDERDRLLAALDALPAVDEVVAARKPPPPPASGDYTSLQSYGFAAPGGIGVAALAGLAGGTGQNVKIIDIEYAWNTAHEDLAKSVGGLIPNGTPSDPFPGEQARHGTAVLGEMIATPNAFGVTGLAAGAGIGMVNSNSTAGTGGFSVANAINVARLNLTPGDVMLVEQQTPGVPNSGIDGPSYVAPEYDTPEYDAIKLATQAGIIVVETAGNGGVNLDGAGYVTPFPRGKPDSGAIIVGAGSGTGACTGSPNSRMSFSTYGARVDLQGWGQCVTTTGYGNLYNADGLNAHYTSTFSGTSSSAPIVASAAALFSSIFKAVTGGRAPSPLAVRQRLIATGTPQFAGDSTHIGPLPNAAAAATGFDFTPPTVAFSAGPSGPGNDATPTFDFAASEPGSTLECRVGAAAFAPCGSPFTTSSLPDGAATFEVRATDAALNPGTATTRAFTVDTVAPAVSIVDGPPEPSTTATPTFTFASEPGATLACRAGAPLALGAPVACASPHTTPALADGPSVFEVQATDAAGNVGAASRAFTVAVPAVRVATPPPPPPPVAPPPAPPTFGPGAKLTVSAAGNGALTLPRPRITCPSLPPSCSVSLTAKLVSGRKTQIGTATRTIAAGKSATIGFRLNASARARLRRLGRIKASAAITARHGSAQAKRTVQLTINRRR